MSSLLFKITISSSIVALVIVLVRFLLRNKLSSKLKYYMWFIFIIRLVFIPLPESKISIFNFINPIDTIKESINEGLSIEKINPIKVNRENKLQDINNKDKNTINNNLKDKNNELDIKSIFSNLYILGVISLLLYNIISYNIFRYRINKNKEKVSKLYMDKLEEIKKVLKIKRHINMNYGNSSFIYGIFEINLVISKDLNEEEIETIIIHELMHYKYKDLLINWLIIILNSIYWFNPVVWLVFRQMKKDCEVVCDERVIESKLINKISYAEILLKNALNHNKYLVGTTSFLKNKSDIKERIKNIRKFKKPKFILIALMLIIVGIVSSICLTNPYNRKDEVLAQDNNIKSVNISKELQELINKLKETNKIKVYHDFHNDNINTIEPVTINDKDIISNFLDLLNDSITESNYDMSGMSVKNQKVVFYTDTEKIEISYSYDSLYEFGFIEYKDNRFYLPYEFFRLIVSTSENSPKKSNIEDDVEKLFKKYNWTPSFLINSEERILPKDLLYSPEKGTDEIYWAYNMKLSKEIDLDFSNLLSKKVEVNMYYLIETMPKFAEPMVDAMGVVIKYEGKIVGAYIQSSIINRAFCTLDRKSFEDISGTSLEDFILKNHVDKDSETDKRLSKMTHEEIIEAYFKSIKERNIIDYLSVLDVNEVINTLDMNSSRNTLFEELEYGKNMASYLKDFKILNIEKENSEQDNTLNYKVEIDMKVNKNSVLENGVYPRIITMKKSTNGVYKIHSEGF